MNEPSYKEAALMGADLAREGKELVIPAHITTEKIVRSFKWGYNDQKKNPRPAPKKKGEARPKAKTQKVKTQTPDEFHQMKQKGTLYLFARFGAVWVITKKTAKTCDQCIADVEAVCQKKNELEAEGFKLVK